jgi:galactokinase
MEKYSALYGNGEVMLLSAPGRSEIIGNHTDHNAGKVLAGAIDRDVIAVVGATNDDTVRIYSEGYGEITVNISGEESPKCFEKYTSASLVGGIICGFKRNGFKVGGFTAYLTSEVLKGSGISSSAAYEVMLGNILNHLYNDGKIENAVLAKIAKFAENEYFGKPCGLMDQMACAVGGFVYIDLQSAENPKTLPISFSLEDCGYELLLVNTGGNHAELNEDYASIPAEMKNVASYFGGKTLREISEKKIKENIPALRELFGDRAILRALHYFGENERVENAKNALQNSDINAFLKAVRESGASSFKYLQNVYTNQNVSEQGISLALMLAEKYVGTNGACRVHGGGFAGTVQVFVRRDESEALIKLMDSVFGKGACAVYKVRPLGAVRLF